MVRDAYPTWLLVQADCFAWVWAHYTDRYRSLLEPGDVDKGLRAASAIGDERLLQRAGKRIRPKSFTYGSSEQRTFWLRKGLESGEIGLAIPSAAAKKLRANVKSALSMKLRSICKVNIRSYF
jgi:hypothetical protein